MNQLDAFIEEIIDKKNLPGVTEEAKQWLIQDMETRLLDTINRALINELPEDKLEGFSSLMDNENITDEEVQKYLTDNGVDVVKTTTKTMLAFRDLYLQPSGEAN